MSSLDDLVRRARQLHAEGHSQSQISDELNLSMETVTYLLMKEREGAVPKDVLIDWTSVSGRADLLDDLAALMVGQSRPQGGVTGEGPSPSAVVGIALSGVPLATLIALQEGLNLAVYFPSRHSVADPPVGSLSGNFAPVNGEACVIVDDVITSGKTLTEAVDYLRGHGATPVAIWVIFDKRGVREIDGVPVQALFRVSRLD
ncbi:MAG TPA: orotate phosphoribosyltransferase-like protein [Methanomicrobiales archaeon]|nr:orotate phosphoribosyltransferase-like protein [Methanomicrobiales archaeon]